MMEQEHESADHIMEELRNLTRGFEPPEWGCITHIALFAGIREFEADLKQHVHLENHHSLEVILAQAPGLRLKRIADELIACKGVKHGYLNVTSTILPPIY